MRVERSIKESLCFFDGEWRRVSNVLACQLLGVDYILRAESGKLLILHYVFPLLWGKRVARRALLFNYLVRLAVLSGLSDYFASLVGCKVPSQATNRSWFDEATHMDL